MSSYVHAIDLFYEDNDVSGSTPPGEVDLDESNAESGDLTKAG